MGSHPVAGGRPKHTLWISRLAVAAVLASAWVGLGLAVPAEACGCGAVISQDNAATVPNETSVVRWDGTSEDIVMQLTVTGSAEDAAWVLPVPSAATVELGDPETFTRLSALTAPKTVYEHRPRSTGDGAQAPAGDGDVQVLSRQQLGPFSVASLAANDSSALSTWLGDNGFTEPDGFADVVQPYVTAGWQYVAVKLDPAKGDALDGRLDPLHVHFSSSELIYPMRLSALASERETVRLYVLAEHRVKNTDALAPKLNAQVYFAGPITAKDVAQTPKLAKLVGDGMFLTTIDYVVDDPSVVDDDFRFAFAASDTAYRETRTRVVYDDNPDVVDAKDDSASWQLPLFGGFGAALGIGGLALLAYHFANRRSRG